MMNLVSVQLLKLSSRTEREESLPFSAFELYLEIVLEVNWGSCFTLYHFFMHVFVSL
jgi:hypothetical protein